MVREKTNGQRHKQTVKDTNKRTKKQKRDKILEIFYGFRPKLIVKHMCDQLIES